jgi:hypothetical protein
MLTPRFDAANYFCLSLFMFQAHRVSSQQSMKKSLADFLMRLAVSPCRGVQSLQESSVIDITGARSILRNQFVQQDTHGVLIANREFMRVTRGILLHRSLLSQSWKINRPNTSSIRLNNDQVTIQFATGGITVTSGKHCIQIDVAVFENADFQFDADVLIQRIWTSRVVAEIRPPTTSWITWRRR